MKVENLIVRELGKVTYEASWQAMREFTDQRELSTIDELWLLEHLPVFTQGQAGKAEHILDPQHIPIVQTDRGGQVTYHGPGQLMIYTLFDIKRLGLGIRDFVIKLEQTVIDLLVQYHIHAQGRRDAPGIYVDSKKIASIGLRVRRGYAYHGIALNVDMDLTPFSWINPCGFRDLKMTQIAELLKIPLPDLLISIKQQIISCVLRNFGYTRHILTQHKFMELKA